LGLIYYATPQLTGYTISAFEAGVLTFSLNSAAYSSEIIRAGIESIDIGQWEAAQVLGLSRWQLLRGVIFPQAVRNVLPALVNEMVDLLKESALVSTIGEADLLRQAQKVASEKYLYFEPLIIAAACYYVMVMLISFSAKKLEQRLRYA
jgi:ABC-type amino acid transport system permease subunit